MQDYFMYPIDEIELQIRRRTLLKRKKYQESIRNHLEKQLDMSIKDAVTDLYNRHYFDSPFGGTNLHLSDGEALACHVCHDALAS